MDPSLPRLAKDHGMPNGSVADSEAGDNVVVEVTDLHVHFPIRRGVLGRTVGQVYAVDGVSFHIQKGETLGLVGESGSGKSTLARAVLRLIPSTSGKIRLGNTDITHLSDEEMRFRRKDIQIVFQDPYSALNPRMTMGASVAEPLVVQGLKDRKALEQELGLLFNRVGLPAEARLSFPHQLSGGQRQRIGIARALALKPSLIVCDEPVSSLDVSIQAQIINLLEALQDELRISYLFIAHDLAVVEHISHRIAVMYLGKIVESGRTADIFKNPQHPYTRALIEAAPAPGPGARHRKRTVLAGEVPSPINPPSGCNFHTRCPLAMNRCRREEPVLQEVAPEHTAACHLIDPAENFAP